MKGSISSRQLFSTIGLVSAAVALMLFVNLLPDTLKTKRTSAPVVESTTALYDASEQGLPVRLLIPAIGVDASIEHVGLATDGSMGTPTNPANTAWFDRGPRPGERGSAVIDGHFGWQNGVSAVFDDLASVEVGDTIYVEDDQGATARFVVREIRTYGADDDATDVFSSNDRKAHLNLITCGGFWDTDNERYTERTVVFADRE